MKVWIVTGGDLRHGISVMGVYETKDRARLSMAGHIEKLISYYGGGPCVLIDNGNDHFCSPNSGYNMFLKEWEIQ